MACTQVFNKCELLIWTHIPHASHKLFVFVVICLFALDVWHHTTFLFFFFCPSNGPLSQVRMLPMFCLHIINPTLPMRPTSSKSFFGNTHMSGHDAPLYSSVIYTIISFNILVCCSIIAFWLLMSSKLYSSKLPSELQVLSWPYSTAVADHWVAQNTS